MTVLTVGIGKQFSTITAAVKAAAAGDTIDVFADHVYKNDFPYLNKSLKLQAVNGEVKMVETVSPPNGKAMIVAGVKGTTIAINGFDISGVKVGDDNGAAVRYEGGNLSLTNDFFHNNQEGILAANDPNGHITINHSEFAANGDGSGHTHGIYVNQIAQLTITNSYIHDTVVGHEIKSRAADTVITNDRIFDNNSTASYSIDLPDAGNATIKNNVIEQGPHSQNNFILAYGEELARNPGRTVSISGNTIVNDEPGGKLLLNKTATALSFTGNKLWNLSASQYGGPIAASGNVNLAARPSLDTSSLTFINPTVPTAAPQVLAQDTVMVPADMPLFAAQATPGNASASGLIPDPDAGHRLAGQSLDGATAPPREALAGVAQHAP